ncbi:MAG: hypothetical protein AAGB22_01525, partial [Bacteroidota bacterium]
MVRLSRFLLLFSFFLTIAPSSWASHFSGSDITYECLGNDSFRLTFNLFRDCGGAGVGNTQIISIDNPCGGTTNVTATAINPGGTEVTQICAANAGQTACSP